MVKLVEEDASLEKSVFVRWLELNIKQEKNDIKAYSEMDRRRCKLLLDQAVARLEAYEKTLAVYKEMGQIR